MPLFSCHEVHYFDRPLTPVVPFDLFSLPLCWTASFCRAVYSYLLLLSEQGNMICIARRRNVDLHVPFRIHMESDMNRSHSTCNPVSGCRGSLPSFVGFCFTRLCVVSESRSSMSARSSRACCCCCWWLLFLLLLFLLLYCCLCCCCFFFVRSINLDALL